ncbi:hypothetical protein PINS_up011258 [Pythium insidiosum]|nr:hypothetical protein PINS_up011258 [Pythium insidiosum]
MAEALSVSPRPNDQLLTNAALPSSAEHHEGAPSRATHSPSRSNFRFVPTLLRKNWWLKRKKPKALILEVLIPVIFIVAISAIKHQTKKYDVPDGFSRDDESYSLFDPDGYSLVAPYTTPKYAIPETTLTGLLLVLAKLSYVYARDAKTFGIANRGLCEQQVVYGGRVSLNKSSPWSLPLECEGRVSPFKLAIAPDNTFTRQYFFETVKTWYPRLELNVTSNASIVVPSLEDSVVFFSSNEALDEYVKSKTYAKSAEQPRIFGALVFDQYPGDGEVGSFVPIEYTLRLNATVDSDSDTKRYVPRTVYSNEKTWRVYQRNIETIEYQQYTTGGFMTLQTLVARFVNCMPDWSASNKSTSGKCQVTASTAKSNKQLDDRLLQSVTNDPATKQIVGEMLMRDGIDVSALASGLSPSALGTVIGSTQREALLRPLRQAPQPYLGSTTSPFPINSYTRSTFYDVVENVFPMFFMLTYLLPLSKILVSLVAERETRARELMKILGVKESSIVISWYITYVVILLISSILQVIAAKAGVFQESSAVILFLFFFLFSLTILAYAFMLSSVFSKSRTGTYVGVVVFFIMYGVSNAFNDESSESSKNVACLLAPTALVFGVRTLASVETSQIGMSFANSSDVITNFRFSTALWFFALDTVLYTIIGMYLEKVVPKTYGTTEKWYFPLLPSFWLRRRRTGRPLAQKRNSQLDNVEDAAIAINDSSIEPVSVDLANQEHTGKALSVQGLRKVFSVPGGEKVAVKGLHLNMYSGQITCLLGHNGAGKTTLISMLTGVIPPTSGDATFRGLSVRDDMDEIRESLGICFQHDVLYPELTVEEHLDFYARIKGYSGAELTAEVEHKIAEVGLTDKRKTLSSALSGGMKRKLSVAISLLGDSSLVFLDEPTSGMDPYSRRSTWEILMNNRQDRVLVLTTHFMDEADILGDRIAIMAEGELRCCGSPLFLKNRYGAGYNLTIVKEEGCDDAKVIDFVLSRIPSGRVLSNVGAEVAFQLPLDSSAQFPDMFRGLDAQLKHLRVLSYGISVTTMEEVFIKVAEASDEDQQHTLVNKVKHHDADRGVTDVSTQDEAKHNGSGYNTSARASRLQSLFGVQFGALVQKRFRIARRDKRFLLVSLMLPIAWLILGLSLLRGSELTKTDKSIPLIPDGLARVAPQKQVVLVSFCERAVGGWCEQVQSQFSSGVAVPSIAQNVVGNPPFVGDQAQVFGVSYSSASGFNGSDTTGYLLKFSEVIFDRGYRQHIEGQFGGYLIHADNQENVLSYALLVNTSVPHGSVVFKSSIDQAIYRTLAKTSTSVTDPSKLELRVNSHPLPQTAATTALFTSYMSFSACIFIAIAFAYYPGPIVSLLVKERQPEHNSKHQQLVSGVNLMAFWLANYVWDLVIYCIPGGIALILIQAYDLAALTGSSECLGCASDTFTAVIVLFVLFGFAICPYAYCWSFAFREHASAQTKMILINFLVGLGFLIVSFVLDVIDNSTATDINRVLKWFYRLSPIYCLTNGLLDLTILEIVSNGGGEFDKPRPKSPFGLDNVGYEIMFLVIDAILYLALAVSIDYALTFPKIKSIMTADPQIEATAEVEDEDVAAEAERVACGGADKDVIRLERLRKVYRDGHKVAVKNLSFGLKRGECFGFLGINGAGKTTTMKMLTGDIVPTAGGATLSGFDILTQQLEVRREIGYCPQFDALIDLLTVREHLELFAQIKGVPRSELASVVQEKMEQLNLTAFENKLAGSLSGGNKRKLSVAIAMIGSPSILFLDEPSTGMDPVSRRFMWDVISEISTYNKEATVVLTTHSMEECERWRFVTSSLRIRTSLVTSSWERVSCLAKRRGRTRWWRRIRRVSRWRIRLNATAM